MNRRFKSMWSYILSVMMIVTVAFFPGMFNFSVANAAEEAVLQLQINFSGDNNLIATVTPSGQWKPLVMNSERNFAVLERNDGKVSIEFSNWRLRGGNQDSEITVRVVPAAGVIITNLILNFTQSQGAGGGVAVNSGDELTIVTNRLNFLNFFFNVSEIRTLEYVTNMPGLSYPNESFLAGDSITPPAPTMEGFTFLGWYADEELTVLFDEFGNMPARDVTVFADWAEVLGEDDETYVLRFVTNMPGLSFADVIFEAGDSITPPIPTMEGFIFLGWYADEELTVLFDEFGNMPARDVTVFADWGEVLGDDDEELPQTSDTATRSLAFFLLILGLLATTLVKKEELQ